MPWDASARLANAATIGANGSGAGVDVGQVAGFDGGLVEFRMWVGTVTGTTPTLDLKIEESDNDSAYSTVATFAQVAGTKTTKNQYQAVGVVRKRYLRYTATVSGTTPSFTGVTIYCRGVGVDVPDVPAAT